MRPSEAGETEGAEVVPPARPRGATALQIAFFLLFVRPFLLLFIGLRVRGGANLPRTDPFVLIANHSSHLDTLSLLSLFPLRRLARIQPVAAADYFERNRVVSWLSRSFFNILPIARRDITAQNDPIRRMVAALRAGRSLILFPEGTRGAANEVGHFHTGIARLATLLPEIAIVPAYLENMGRALPKGQFVPVPIFCEIRVGQPLCPRGNRKEIVVELEEAVRRLREPS